MRITLSLLLATCAWGGEKLSSDLKAMPKAGTVNVIVQYRTGATAVEVERVKSKSGTWKMDLPGVQGAAFQLPAAEVDRLALDPGVKFVSRDRGVRAALDYAIPTIGADLANRAGVTGAGIGVAVIDSGVNRHADLGNARVVYEESFVPGNKKTEDEYGHGTHVAGIVGSAGAVIKGVAPRVNIVNLRVLDAQGAGTDSAVIAALERAIQLAARYQIRVVNLSLGRPVYESYTTDPLTRAVERAWMAGLTVVVAAGNDGRDNTGGRQGYGTIQSPANHPLVLTVGAMKTFDSPSRADDRIASYSAKGPTILDHVVKPDLVAPGNRIISLQSRKSTLAAQYPANLVPPSVVTDARTRDYFWLSGTSMAAPMVSGAVALLLERDGKLTPDQVKARLMKTATKDFPQFSTATDPVTGLTYTSQYDIFTIGAGYLNVAEALAQTDKPAGWASSPVAQIGADGKVRLATAAAPVWGGLALWGDKGPWSQLALWGENVFVKGDVALWGDNALWGDAKNAAFNALWGDNALWGIWLCGEKTLCGATAQWPVKRRATV